MIKQIYLVLFLFFCANILFAQIPTGIPDNPYGQTARDTLFPDQKEVAEISNVDLTYSFLHAPHLIRTEIRDTLNDEFRKYDPADRADTYHFNLGNPGSPARSAIYAPNLMKGLHTGINQYSIYLIQPDSVRFYNPDIPLTSIFASQGNSQEDGLIDVRFGRRFAKGVNVSLNYNRINQAGVYQQLRAKNTKLSFGVHRAAPSGKLDSYYAYISNTSVQENSGGIIDYELLSNPANSIRASIPVYLSDAISTLRDRYFLMQHHYHFLTKGDSLNNPKPLFDISYKLEWNPYSFKYADSSIGGNSDTLYDSFINDSRGVRNFISYRKMTNEFGITLFVNPENKITASLEHRAIALNQEPNTDNRNEIYLNGAIQTKWLKRFDLNASGYLGLLDGSGFFNLDAKATISFDEYGKLSGRLMTYQRRPFLLEESLFVNQIESYKRSFKNVNINLIGVEYQNPKWKITAQANWWVVNNLVYYGADRLPIQIDNATSIRQISLSKDLKIGPLLLLNKITLQNFTEESLRLPSVILQESISLNGRIFKKSLQYQIGVDLTMTNTHRGVTYFPLTGQFTLSDERMVTSFPALDAFLSFRIKSLKVFLKSENINAFFNDDVYDQIIGYPQFENYFRFGFSFQLFN